MSSDVVISVRNLSKCYPIYDRPQDRLKQMLWPRRGKFHDEFWALKDVNFEVKKGETVGIVGRNGSGKSTLLQLICGTVSPTTGTVERKGRLSALLELGSGFNPEFSGRENVYLNGSILGLSKEEMEHRFDKIASFADIGQFMDSPVKHYSSGMFARLAFSVAIHVEPEILIVDEILAVGDMAFQRRCLSKFYEIRDSGCAILFVSHDQYQVKSVCERAVYLHKGRQKLFGSAGRVIDDYMVDIEEAEAKRDEKSDEQQGTGSTNAKVPIAEDQMQHPFVIDDVKLTTSDGIEVDEISTGAELFLTMNYRAITSQPPEKISFVFNLYRHDGFYITGTTTLMDGMPPHPGTQGGRVSVRFPSIPLLSGCYKWRVAINDHGGFSVLAEAKDVCMFKIVDDFNAVGIVNLNREWQIEIG